KALVSHGARCASPRCPRSRPGSSPWATSSCSEHVDTMAAEPEAHVHSRVTRVADTALARSSLQPLFRRRTSRRLAALAYHGVDAPEQFARQLDYLVDNANVVSLDDAIDGLLGRRPLPRDAVLITFDDGLRSVLEKGLPLLQERRLPSAAFVVAGVLDTDEPLWFTEVEQLVAAGARATQVADGSPRDAVRQLKRVADGERRAAIAALRASAATAPRMPQLRSAELRRMESSGMAVGSHSLTHACLDRCDEATIRSEVEEAHRILKDALGHPPRAFAYPNGDHDDRVVGCVAETGYDVALLFDHRITRVPAREPHRVSRVRANSTTSLDRLRIIVSGLHPALHALRGRS